MIPALERRWAGICITWNTATHWRLFWRTLDYGEAAASVPN